MSKEEFCQIGFHTESGRLVARDPSGRRVQGVRAISVEQRFGDATIITVEIVSHPDGEGSMLKGFAPQDSSSLLPAGSGEALTKQFREFVADGAKVNLE